MTNFEKVLEAWNNGIFRGAKVKLSRKIGVNDSTISAWLGGHSKPGVDKIKKMSEILNISEDDILKMFNIDNKNSIHNLNSNNNVKGNITQTINGYNLELFKKDLEIMKEKLISQDLKLDLILEKLKKGEKK
jgi:transcriptional regulator with XRE-family HTH domain